MFRQNSSDPSDLPTTTKQDAGLLQAALPRRAFLKNALSAISLTQMPSDMLTSLFSESALAGASTVVKAATSKNVLGGILNLVKSASAFQELCENRPRAGFTAYFLADDEGANVGTDRSEAYKHVSLDDIQLLQQNCERYPRYQFEADQALNNLLTSRDALLALDESKQLIQSLKPACLKINQESKDFLVERLKWLSSQLTDRVTLKDKEKLHRLDTVLTKSKCNDRALIGDQKKWMRVLSGISELEETYCGISFESENRIFAAFSEFQYSLVLQAEESALLTIGLTPANTTLFRERLADNGTNLFQLLFGHVSSLLPEIEGTVDGKHIGFGTSGKGVSFLDRSFKDYQRVFNADISDHFLYLKENLPRIDRWHQWRDHVIQSTGNDPAKNPTSLPTPEIPEPFELSENGYALLSSYDVTERLKTEIPDSLSLLTWITNFRDRNFYEAGFESHSVLGRDNSLDTHSVDISLESEGTRQVLVLTSDTFLQATILSAESNLEQVALVCGDILVVDCSMINALSLAAGSYATVQVTLNRLREQPIESDESTH